MSTMSMMRSGVRSPYRYVGLGEDSFDKAVEKGLVSSDRSETARQLCRAAGDYSGECMAWVTEAHADDLKEILDLVICKDMIEGLVDEVVEDAKRNGSNPRDPWEVLLRFFLKSDQWSGHIGNSVNW